MEARRWRGVIGWLADRCNKGFRYATSRKGTRLILASGIFIGLAFAFYLRYLLVYTGYPGWGNFVTPLTPNALLWSPVFNPFQFNSIPSSTPLTFFLGDIFLNVPLWVLSHFMSISSAERLYVLGSAALFMLAGYAVSGQLTRKFPLRVFAVAFLAFNPLMIMILSAGDSEILVAQAFTFIALYFMLLDSQKPGRFPAPYLVLSWVFLSFSLLSYQAFFLGILLYCTVFVLFRYRSAPSGVPFWSYTVREAARVIGYVLIGAGVVIILLLPEIVPLLQGGISAGAYVVLAQDSDR